MPSDKIITEEDPRAVALEFAKKIGANQKINDPSGKTRRRESKNYKTYNKQILRHGLSLLRQAKKS